MTSGPPSWNYKRYIENPTPSIDAYLLEEQPCQISIWNVGNLGFLKESPQQEQDQGE